MAKVKGDWSKNIQLLYPFQMFYIKSSWKEMYKFIEYLGASYVFHYIIFYLVIFFKLFYMTNRKSCLAML